jgi:hypothetical protein
VDWLNKLGDSAFWPRQLDLLKDDPYLIAVIVVGAVIGWLVRKLWDQPADQHSKDDQRKSENTFGHV